MIGWPQGVIPFVPVTTPPAEIPPPSAESEHYCPTPGCDASWWGPAPCWVCGAEGVSRAALPEPDRKVWSWTNQFRPPAEGDLPA